ncbi:hypothetical protein U9M48_005578 [Paspalum notatum var. saurae]|uniref:Uncharacterized protein n=1 Tax=Paspalum notatum var. saurae TaxID=547442 RepID=A0AAQ3PSJ0_PASNO
MHAAVRSSRVRYVYGDGADVDAVDVSVDGVEDLGSSPGGVHGAEVADQNARLGAASLVPLRAWRGSEIVLATYRSGMRGATRSICPQPRVASVLAASEGPPARRPFIGRLHTKYHHATLCLLETDEDDFVDHCAAKMGGEPDPTGCANLYERKKNINICAGVSVYQEDKINN